MKALKNRRGAERFRKEIKAAVTLDHPGILKVVDWDDDSYSYHVAPLYEAGDLASKDLAQMRPVRKFELFAQICDAVGYAHGQGVIHRDIKPANVLIASDGSPVVADFGLCFFKDSDEERQTQPEEAIGSRYFKAPELEDGRADEVTPAADVYSLGKVLYWMFAGRSFEREKHHEERFDLRPQEPRTVHAFLYEIIDGAIAEKPQMRAFKDGAALAAAAVSAARRLAMDGHVLNLETPQRCHYCCAGDYKIRVDPRWWFLDRFPDVARRINLGSQPGHQYGMEQLRTYGITAGGQGMPWLVLVCESCGNLQIFKLWDQPGLLREWGLA